MMEGGGRRNIQCTLGFSKNHHKQEYFPAGKPLIYGGFNHVHVYMCGGNQSRYKESSEAITLCARVEPRKKETVRFYSS